MRLWGLFAVAVFVLTPPERFRHDSVATVAFRSAEATNAYCRAWGARPDAYACEMGGVLNLPNQCGWGGGDPYAELACHELAHANGWPADHPQR